MKNTLATLQRLIGVMTGIVIVLMIIIRMDENVPLWVMILAVLCALFDGFLVVGYSHSKGE